MKSFYGECVSRQRRHFGAGSGFSRANVVARETDVIRAQLKRNGVSIFQGLAQFADPHTMEVRGDAEKTVLHGEQHPDRVRDASSGQCGYSV